MIDFCFVYFWILFLSEYGVIKDEKIADVMRATDRKLYCRVAYPYVDRPHSIGHSATISGNFSIQLEEF